MRLTEFSLERYGAFLERELSIPSATGLVIVYGPNEAGKSTCLSAISDFLFGIPVQTRNGSLFGYDGMRLGATVVDAAGSTQTLRRRRGRGKTLTDEAGNALEDTVLTRLLGATTRERFTTLFGLNHETLRSGGASLLSADGDIGRLIVEAGGGMRSLLARLDAINDEASTLFTPRRNADRAFYKALTAYEEADKDVRALAVSRDAYEQARKAADKADTHLSDLRHSKLKLLAEVSSLERLSRTLPYLLELERLDAGLAEFKDLADQPHDLHIRVEAALSAVEAAAEGLASAKATRDRLHAKDAALAIQPGYAEADAAIRDLAEKLVIIRKARSDRANRMRDLDAAESQLSTLRRMLQLGPDASVEDRLPQQAALDRVQQLANEAIERRGKLAVIKKRADELQDQLGVLEKRIAAARSRGSDKPPAFGPSQFINLPGQLALCRTSEQQARKAAEHVLCSITELGFSSIAELKAFPCPSADEIRAEQSWHGKLEDELKDAANRIIGANGRISLAEETIKQLEIRGPIASDETISEARTKRAEAWMPIRSSFATDTVPADSPTRLGALENFEAKIALADDLADRRTSEADRAANLALVRKQLAESMTDRSDCETLIGGLQTRAASRREAWRVAFPKAVELYSELPALLAFAERKVELLAEHQEAEALSQASERAKAELRPSETLLARALREAKLSTEGAELSEAVQALGAKLSQHETEHSDYKRDLRDYEVQQPVSVRARAESDALEGEQASWEQDWPAALTTLGLTASLAPEQAGALIAEWSSARGTLATIAQTRARLTRMNEDEHALKDAARALGSKLSLTLSEDPLAAADLIVTRWEEQDALRQQRLALAPELKEAETETRTHESKHAEAMASLTNLIKLTRVDNEFALVALSGRCKGRAELAEARTLIENSLSAISDGLEPKVLIEQAAGRDLDAIRSALATTKAEAAQVEVEVEEAILSKKAATDNLAKFGEESGLNRAVAARESAAARMQGIVERYVELSVARDLISEAIDRVRSEQQDPLIKRASELFSHATLGGFSGIECDLDDKGQPVVVGKRASGGDVPVSAMSDGTRDQMFLAFRLASLESYASSAEPLPFVADDILVHFDDYRSRATLDLLASFGKTNQVLLFTHHQSVRELARPLVEQGLASVLELAPA